MVIMKTISYLVIIALSWILSISVWYMQYMEFDTQLAYYIISEGKMLSMNKIISSKRCEQKWSSVPFLNHFFCQINAWNGLFHELIHIYWCMSSTMVSRYRFILPLRCNFRYWRAFLVIVFFGQKIQHVLNTIKI